MNAMAPNSSPLNDYISHGSTKFRGRCQIEGSMMSHPVHYWITIQIIELNVWTIIGLDVHAHNHMPWVWTSVCCVYEVCPIPYHQNVCHGHHIRALGDLGENGSTWRQKGIWIYFNHHNPYMLMVNCGVTNKWVCCNGDLDCSALFCAPPQGGWNTVHQRGWRQVLYTRIALSHNSGSSITYHMWRTYTWIQVMGLQRIYLKLQVLGIRLFCCSSSLGFRCLVFGGLF